LFLAGMLAAGEAENHGQRRRLARPFRAGRAGLSARVQFVIQLSTSGGRQSCASVAPKMQLVCRKPGSPQRQNSEKDFGLQLYVPKVRRIILRALDLKIFTKRRFGRECAKQTRMEKGFWLLALVAWSRDQDVWCRRRFYRSWSSSRVGRITPPRWNPFSSHHPVLFAW
jgi:hypothetical protein